LTSFVLGTAVALSLFAMLPVAAARGAFGFESASSVFSAQGGGADPLTAGSHPGEWTTTLTFNAGESSGRRRLDAYVRNLHIELPSGLVANPTLVPHCPRVDFLEENCPTSSAVGSIVLSTDLPVSPSTSTVFLLEPPPGQVAQLGYWIEKHLPVTIDISISPRPPYELIASLINVSQAAQLFGLALKIEGVPHGIPLLTLPSNCSSPLSARYTGSSWDEPDAAVSAAAPEYQSLVGCASVPYSPALEAGPTTTAPSSPSGINLRFDATDPGLESAAGPADAATQRATATLPAGMTINPSVAAGLTVCSPTQLAAEEVDSEPGDGCPESSKVGSATVTTPLLSGAVEGSIYLSRREGTSSTIVTDPTGSHLVLEAVLRNTAAGVLLVLPLDIDMDAGSGRVTASLDQIPQLPISHLELHLNSGPRAPLTTPSTCGPHSIDYSLEPSSGNPPLTGSRSFSTTSSDCDPAFAPSLVAGTTFVAAGRTAPFVFELNQDAAAPNSSALSITLPRGLSATFTGIPICSEGGAAAGDCPVDSKLGYARIALGSGPEPLWVPAGEEPDSDVFLAGPYKGASYSLVIVVPGQAGPFDLGTVVLRAPIAIDPATAQASISVEGLPQIMDGVPLHYRTIRVVLDRPGFIRNPTSCEPAAITGTATAADGSTAAISARFQAADCAALSFKPKLSVRLSGAVGRNGHPAARAVLRADPNGAAVSSADFTLSAGELLDLDHLRGLCPRGVAVARCPRKSLLGRLRLDSPLLGEPLAGPVYLRVPKHGLPELAAEVGSGGLAFAVDGRITRTKGRLGVSLGSIPDVPLTEAVLELPGGRTGLIVNSRSLCRSKGEVTGTFTAHNGMSRRLSAPVQVAGCR
jgi:hypothetical protein